MTRIALIAHDEKKPELIEFAQTHEKQLQEYELLGTGTTGQRLVDETRLDVERKKSGPLGGDLQIGSEVAEGLIDGIVFLRDPLRAQPHEPDITALMRICDVHDVGIATNLASAEFLIEGLSTE